MSLTKVTYSMIVGAETNILDFIPPAEHAAILAGTSTYDCGPDITTAINALKGSTSAKALYFPKGTYSVASTITLTTIHGFKFFGDGIEATIIKYTPTTGSLFYITDYLQNAFYDIKFFGSNYTTSVTNRCFRLNGTGGGTGLLFQNCFFYGFGKQITTTDTTVNDDTVTFNSCYFWYQNYVWDNTNEQAVSWTWNDCQVLFTETTVLNNPGGFSRVIGGTYINQGTFVNASAVAAIYGLLFDSIKFEPYGAVKASKYLTMGGVTYVQATFKNCSDTTGFAFYATPTFELRNLFEVQFIDCNFSQGIMTVQANSDNAGAMADLSFINSTTPQIVETLYAGEGNTPVNKYYQNSNVSNGTTSYDFTGSSTQFITPKAYSVPVIPSKQKITISNVNIAASVYNLDFNIPIPINGTYIISNIDFYYFDGNPVSTAVITLFTNIAETTQIYTYSKGASAAVQVDSADLGTLLTAYALTSSTAKLRLKVVPTGDVGLPLVSMVLTLTSFK